MKSYKLNIKFIIGTVGLLSLLLFSMVLFSLKIAKMHSLGEILLHYGFIIAPISILWVVSDQYLWHTKLLQSMRKPLNIPPDLRGRWEGILENADGSEPQKFVIEVKQTLSSLSVYSFSTIGHSSSILSEIASSEHEDLFTLCYLWQGEINISTSVKDFHHRDNFYGYTMLNLHEHENPKILKGSYFTNHKPTQTRGGIFLTWVSHTIKRKLE